MFNLILNENMKIYRRWRTWILLILLVVITVSLAFINHSFSSKLSPDSSPVWSGVQSSAHLIMVVILFTVIIAADIVAGEFTWGTIKLLLIRPASRSKILLSKYLATLLFALFCLVVLFVSSLIANICIYGFTNMNSSILEVVNNQVVESNLVLKIFQAYGFECVGLLMTATMAFMISTVFRSSALAIGFSTFIMFAGQSISTVLMKLHYSWVKYWLFANTDLTQYSGDMPNQDGMTLSFSISILIVYYLVFCVLAWTIFKKRDVAA